MKEKKLPRKSFANIDTLFRHLSRLVKIRPFHATVGFRDVKLCFFVCCRDEEAGCRLQ